LEYTTSAETRPEVALSVMTPVALNTTSVAVRVLMVPSSKVNLPVSKAGAAVDFTSKVPDF